MSRSPDAPDERRQAKLVQDLSHAVQRALLEAMLHLAAPGASERVAMTVPRARVPTAPAWLARHHPGGAAAQAEARALYERCLAHHREILSGAPEAGYDDVGAVLARFVVANLQALRELDVTPAVLDRLGQQLAGILQRSPAWLRADLRGRQSYMEQLALVGVLVRETSVQAVLQGPDAVAHVQRAARGYLLQLLGLDADRLTVGQAGLTFVDAA